MLFVQYILLQDIYCYSILSFGQKDEPNLRADSRGIVLSMCTFERKKQLWRRNNKPDVAAFTEQETSG